MATCPAALPTGDIDQHLFSPARAVGLIRQACASLRQAHARGIVHRDVRPSNLFLTRHPRGGDLLKVLDFGIARRLQGDEARLTLDGDAIGTPQFMAPETFRGAAPLPQVDVYGLGATLYFLVTGARPFGGGSPAALASAVTSAELVRPAARTPLPDALDAVIVRALSRDLAERYASVDALDAALAELEGPLLESHLGGAATAEHRVGNDEPTLAIRR